MRKAGRIVSSLAAGAAGAGLAAAITVSVEGFSEPYDVSSADNKACIASLGRQSLALCPDDFNGYPADKPHQEITLTNTANIQNTVSIPTQAGYSQYVHQRYEDHIRPGETELAIDAAAGILVALATSAALRRQTSAA